MLIIWKNEKEVMAGITSIMHHTKQKENLLQEVTFIQDHIPANLRDMIRRIVRTRGNIFRYGNNTISMVFETIRNIYDM
jgi:hypothetical protein